MFLFIYDLVLVLFSFSWYITESAAAPIDGVPISNSSDAWANLVANIAPLLILIGEKHVKAYFKTMSTESHFLLYAVSPIGLVTALVTLIRLHGTPLMKRLIGRQFETKAEVLADVSSVSFGDVGLVYREDTGSLEQSTSPLREREALCGIYLGTTGTGETFSEQLHDCYNITKEYRGILSLDSTQTPSWYSINTLHFTGNIDMHKIHRIICVIRDEQNFYLRGRIPHIRQPNCNSSAECTTKPILGDDCISTTVWYLSGPGVLPTLTAAASSKTSNAISAQALGRRIASAVCFGLNWVIVAIVIKTGESLTSIFLGVGVAGSFLGSWWTARMIHSAGMIHVVSLRRFNVLSFGFFASSSLHGTGATFAPRCLAISTSSAHSPAIWLTLLLSTGSYVLLYLGLRVANWWVPLATLGVVGTAACLRAVLIENGRVATVENSCTGDVFNFLRRRNAMCQHMIEQRNAPEVTTHSTSLHGIKATLRNAAVQNLEEHRFDKSWTILTPSGDISTHLAMISGDGIHDVQARLLFNAYAVASYLHCANLQPRLQDPTDLVISDRLYARSEFLGKDAIWQQQLKIFIPPVKKYGQSVQHPSTIYQTAAALLRIWVTEALVGPHECQMTSERLPSGPASIAQYDGPHASASVLLLRYSTDAAVNEINALRRTAQLNSKNPIDDGRSCEDDWAAIWSNKVMLWMAVKIICALKPTDMPYDVFGAQVQREHGEMMRTYTESNAKINDLSIIGAGGPSDVADLVPWYVSQLIAAGLVAPMSEWSSMTGLRFPGIYAEET